MSAATPAILGRPEEALLRALGRFHYLTAQQALRAVGYSPAALTFVQAKLKGLTAAGYCLRRSPGHAGRTGSAPFVYTLARKGQRLLDRQGLPGRAGQPAEFGGLTPYFLRHNLAVTDFLISADLLPRCRATFRIADLKHDRELRRRPVRVRLPDGRDTRVIPDGWVDVRDGPYQDCLALELDRGTEEQAAWRGKIAALLAFGGGPYQEAFGTEALTIVVVATPGEGRAAELLRWTEAELLHRRASREQGDMFWFTGCDPASGPEALFFTPVWRRPFRTEPEALWGPGAG